MSEDKRRFIPCDGASICAHPPNVFLERRPCRGGKGGGKAVFFECVFCKQRRFCRGIWMRAPLLTAAQVRAMVPPGMVAIDGNGEVI